MPATLKRFTPGLDVTEGQQRRIAQRTCCSAALLPMLLCAGTMHSYEQNAPDKTKFAEFGNSRPHDCLRRRHIEPVFGSGPRCGLCRLHQSNQSLRRGTLGYLEVCAAGHCTAGRFESSTAVSLSRHCLTYYARRLSCPEHSASSNCRTGRTRYFFQYFICRNRYAKS